MSLGQALYGMQDAGVIFIHEAAPSAQLFTPSALKFSGMADGVEIIRDNKGAIRQVKAASGLADVVTINSLHYEVRFYPSSSIGTKVNRLYQFNGNPVATCTVQNSDASGVTVNQFLFYRTASGSTDVSKYTWTAASQQWDLITGGDVTGTGWLRRESVQNIAPDGNYSRTEIRKIFEPNQSLVRKRVTYYQVIAGLERPVVQVEDPQDADDPNGAALTTTWTYTAGGRLEKTVGPNGSWSWSEFDGQGLQTKLYSGFLNQTPVKDDSLCRVQEFDYTPLGGGDDGTVSPFVPRTIVEKLLGQVVGLTYRVITPGQLREIRCQRPDATWDATDNLVSITRTNLTGGFVNELKDIQYPDGTMAIYEYATNSAGTMRTTTVSVGQPSEDKACIIDGVRTVTVVGVASEVLSVTATDIVSTKTIGRVLYSNFDEFHRWQRADYLDGTFETHTYSCCGIGTAVDRQGVTTTYTYDGLKRLTKSLRDDIAIARTYDAEGRVLTTVRKGTDNSEITLMSAQYDLAGRMTASSNPTTGITTYSEMIDSSSGQTTRTTTYTNSATRIEVYASNGTLLQVGGTAVHGVRYDYGFDNTEGAAYTLEIKQWDDGSGDTSEWAKNYMDMIGRQYKTLYPDDAYSQSFYNGKGQLWKQRDPDNVLTLFKYNAKGELEYQALHRDETEPVDTAPINLFGTDQIIRTVKDFVSDHGFDVGRTRTYVWNQDDNPVPLLTDSSETALTALRSWSTTFGQTQESRTIINGNGYVTVTTLTPDGAYSVSSRLNGRVLGTTTFDANGAQLGGSTQGYDAHQRPWLITDARNGTTTNYYNDADQVCGTATPAPGPGLGSLVTTNYFEEMGRIWKTTQPDTTSVVNEYHLTGELKKTSGSRTYPVEYTYDYAGRVKTMKTWQDLTGNSGTATTTWSYDEYRGWLNSKAHDDGKGPIYSYTDAGRLQTRTWAREVSGDPLTTTYGYNTAGQLWTVEYNDGVTPSVTQAYDRRGQLRSVVRDSMTMTRSYKDASLTLSEAYSGGVLDGLSVTNGYDQFLRRTNFTLLNAPSSVLATTAYGYDRASRLAAVTNGSLTVAYGYLANSPLVESLTFKNADNGSTLMATTKSYDYVNRPKTVSSTDASSTVISASAYAHNTASQRTTLTDEGQNHWTYQYDGLGQVTSGWKYDANNTVLDGHQFNYSFDDIGNRTSTTINGVTKDYTANLLNQYTEVETTTPAYDDDGNLTFDGTWTYIWDGENRLVAMEKGDQRLVFTYDWQGRRVRKQVFTGSTENWTPGSDTRFVYDGWNLIAELDTDNSALRTYTWGLDVSGDMQGAGGVGGLLWLNDTADGTHLACYDGNGNMRALVKANDSSLITRYEYGPFGELAPNDATSMSSANPFRFSTKYQDNETGLIYFGYRYYQADVGAWLGRDPLPARRDLNLYGLTRNSPANAVDYLGLDSLSTCQALAMAANNGRATGNKTIDDLVKQIAATITCNFIISCKSKCVDSKCASTTTTDSDGTPLGTSSKISICFDGKTDAEIASTIAHELQHAMQDCKGNTAKDCSSCLCRELQAYHTENPAMPVETLKKRAYASCSIPEPLIGNKPMCDSSKTADTIMTPSFESSCASSGYPPGGKKLSGLGCGACGASR
jgi:RHS repeat-associated protein